MAKNFHINPFPNEHALRLKDPDGFDSKSFRRTKGSGKGKVQGVKIPSSISVIWGKLKGKAKPADPPIAQALRFPISSWGKDPKKAKKWIKDNKIKGTFEAASEPEENMEIFCFEINVSPDEIQYKEFMGKKHLVAPVVLLVEGVHNLFFYPADELAKFPASWNGIPLPIYHPEDEESGVALSCTDPEIMQEVVVGNLWNVVFDPDGNKLKGEVWVDIDRANEIDSSIVPALTSGYNMEVSTGLWADHIMESGEWEGEEYIGTLTNYRPDHLALLPGAAGACSWEDGCGIRANRRKEEALKKDGKQVNKDKVVSNDDESVAKSFVKVLAEKLGLHVYESSHEDVRQALQDQLAEYIKPKKSSGDAEPELGSYSYVREVFDNYLIFESRDDDGSGGLWKLNYTMKGKKIELSGEPVAVRLDTKYVELKAQEPDDGAGDGKPDGKGTTSKEVDDGKTINIKEGKAMEKKKELIMKLLTTNEGEDCVFCEEDKEYLEGLSEEKLERLVAKFVPEEKPEVNADEEKKKADEEKKKADELKANEDKKAAEEKKKADELKANEDKKKADEGNEPEKKEMTFDEFMANAPVEYKEMVTDGLKIQKDRKDSLVKAVMANDKNKFTKEQLEAKAIDELEALVALIGDDVDFSLNAGGDSDDEEPKHNERQKDGKGVPDMPVPLWDNEGKPDLSHLH
jgi:hypothetical protein